MHHRIQKDKIDELATKYNYNCIAWQGNIGMASYSDGITRINVYLTTMTVGTCLIHPTKNATQLFRKDIDIKTLEKIFANPRVHTGKGYYKK